MVYLSHAWGLLLGTYQMLRIEGKFAWDVLDCSCDIGVNNQITTVKLR